MRSSLTQNTNLYLDIFARNKIQKSLEFATKAKNLSIEGHVRKLYDKEVGKHIIQIRGNISNNNYLSLSNLKDEFRFIILHVKFPPNKKFSLWIQFSLVSANDNLPGKSFRLVFSNSFTNSKRINRHLFQFRLDPPRGWGVLAVDLDSLARHVAVPGQPPGEVKQRIQSMGFHSNLSVRTVFFSDVFLPKEISLEKHFDVKRELDHWVGLVDQMEEDCSFGEILYQKRKKGKADETNQEVELEKENVKKQLDLIKRNSRRGSKKLKKKKNSVLKPKTFSQKRIFQELTDQVFEDSENSKKSNKNNKKRKGSKTGNKKKLSTFNEGNEDLKEEMINILPPIDSIQEIKEKEILPSQPISDNPFYPNQEINQHSKLVTRSKENNFYQKVGKQVFGHEIQKLFELTSIHHFNSKYSEIIPKPKLAKTNKSRKEGRAPRLKTIEMEPISIKTETNFECPDPFFDVQKNIENERDPVGLCCSLDANGESYPGQTILYRSGRHVIRTKGPEKGQMIFGAGFVKSFLFIEELRLVFLCETIIDQPEDDSELYNFNLKSGPDRITKVSVFDFDTGYLRGHFFVSIDDVVCMNYLMIQKNDPELIDDITLPNKNKLNQVFLFLS